MHHRYPILPVAPVNDFGFSSANTGTAAVGLALTAYNIWGKKQPKINVDVPIYSSQPPPPTYVNWTPTIVLVGVVAIGLTMLATSK